YPPTETLSHIRRWMQRGNSDRIVQVAGFDDHEAPNDIPRLHEWSVDNRGFAILGTHGGHIPLQTLHRAHGAGAVEFGIVLLTLLDQGSELLFGELRYLLLVSIQEAQVLHGEFSFLVDALGALTSGSRSRLPKFDWRRSFFPREQLLASLSGAAARLNLTATRSITESRARRVDT